MFNEKIIFNVLKEGNYSYTYDISQNKLFKIFFILSGKTTIRINVNMLGRNCRADIRIGAFLTSDHNIMIRTVQNHRSRDSQSDLAVKSINSGRSTLDFEGVIKVESQAVQTSAYQRCDSLILSSEAGAVVKPILEISTDDVRCTHGTTVAPVRSDEAEYLMTRGIKFIEAKKIISRGFIESLFTDADDKYKILMQKCLDDYFLSI